MTTALIVRVTAPAASGYGKTYLVASLRMVTLGAEFRGVTLHRLYFKECIVGKVY